MSPFKWLLNSFIGITWASPSARTHSFFWSLCCMLGWLEFRNCKQFCLSVLFAVQHCCFVFCLCCAVVIESFLVVWRVCWDLWIFPSGCLYILFSLLCCGTRCWSVTFTSILQPACVVLCCTLQLLSYMSSLLPLPLHQTDPLHTPGPAVSVFLFVLYSAVFRLSEFPWSW